MNQKQFEQQLKNKVSTHQVSVDTDELWDAIEPALPPKDKRKGIGVWCLLAIGLGFSLLGGFTYWGLPTAPQAQLVDESINEALKKNEKLSQQQLVEKDALPSQTELLDLTKTNNRTENRNASKTTKSAIQTKASKPSIRKTTQELAITPNLATTSTLNFRLNNNKAITKSETKTSVVETLNSLPPNWSMLTAAEADTMDKRAKAATPAAQQSRKKWSNFIALNGSTNLVARRIEPNSTALSEQLMDNYISLREMTEASKNSPSMSAYFGKEHKQSGLYAKAGFRYTKVNSVFEIKNYTETRFWDENGLSEIVINSVGDSTFIYDGNWLTEQTTQNIRHYNEIHVLDIPLILGKQFSLSEKIKLGLEAGLAWNVLFRPKGRILNPQEQVIYVDESDYKSTNIGASVVAGVHWDYHITESVGITFGANYQKYLGSWMEKTVAVTETYQVIGLELGLKKGF